MNSTSQTDIEITPILKKNENQTVGDGRNELLADYTTFHQNVKGLHRNFQGTDYFNFHQKFEDLCEKLNLDINNLTEQIALFGYEPLLSYSGFFKNSIQKEITAPNTYRECLMYVIEGLKSLIFSITMAANTVEEKGKRKIVRQFGSELENELWVFTMLAKY